LKDRDRYGKFERFIATKFTVYVNVTEKTQRLRISGKWHNVIIYVGTRSFDKPHASIFRVKVERFLNPNTKLHCVI